MRNLNLVLSLIFCFIYLPLFAQDEFEVKTVRLNCQAALEINSDKKDDLTVEPSMTIQTDEATRKVYILTKDEYKDWFERRPADSQMIEAHFSDDRLPLPSVQLKRNINFWFKSSVSKIYRAIYKEQMMRTVLKFDAGPNGEVTAARVLEIFNSLDPKIYSERRSGLFCVQIGDLLFKGDEFFWLVQQANNHEFVSINTERGFKDTSGAANAYFISQFHYLFSRALVFTWFVATSYITYIGGAETPVSIQQASEFSHFGMFAYLGIAGASTFLQQLLSQDKDSNFQSHWFKKLFYFLPDLRGLKDSSQYLVVKHQRAKTVVENIEKAMAAAPSKTQIVIVTNDKQESEEVLTAMKERFTF